MSELFTEAKARRGVSYADVAEFVSDVMGYRVNDELVRQYHQGATKRRPNLAVIAAIAEYYGLKAADLPADVLELCTRSRAVFERLGVPSTPPGTRTRNLQMSTAA